MLKIAICDDEKIYLEFAEKILSKNFKNDELKISLFDNKADFDKIFVSCADAFDIIITDIEMPDMNGIEFAKYVRTKNEQVRIIFLTNYLEYATEIYDTEHTFFVLKKDAESKLPAAIKKAVSQLDSIQAEFIAVETDHLGTAVININDIIYIERYKRVSIIKTASGNVITHWNLDKLQKLIKSKKIFRVHRSYMVNMKHIKRFSCYDLTMTDDTIIHITRNYSKEFKENLMDFIKS